MPLSMCSTFSSSSEAMALTHPEALKACLMISFCGRRGVTAAVARMAAKRFSRFHRCQVPASHAEFSCVAVLYPEVRGRCTLLKPLSALSFGRCRY